MINLIMQYSTVHARNIGHFSVKIPVEKTQKEDVIKTASSQTHTRCFRKPVLIMPYTAFSSIFRPLMRSK